jgi:AraC family transcriptional regulator of adaptative response/methylated-DNA-[protein]-cysteine methyltransferase
MVRAMLASDAAYEGVFYTAVKTTGIFCRPTCTARKPKPENVVFHRTAESLR